MDAGISRHRFARHVPALRTGQFGGCDHGDNRVTGVDVDGGTRASTASTRSANTWLSSFGNCVLTRGASATEALADMDHYLSWTPRSFLTAVTPRTAPAILNAFTRPCSEYTTPLRSTLPLKVFPWIRSAFAMRAELSAAFTLPVMTASSSTARSGSRGHCSQPLRPARRSRSVSR